MQIAVCSWSLAMPDLSETLKTVRDELGLNRVHLGFLNDDHYQEPDKVVSAVADSGVQVSATCVGFVGEDYSSIRRIAETGGFLPDAEWEKRFAKTTAVADLTKQLGVTMLAAHIGFVPHDKNDPKYAVMVDRIKAICDEFGKRGLTLLMETGQERAESLLSFMGAVGRDNIGVNFDPANMILYGVGDPVKAVTLLRDRIRHVHMKDATASSKPGTDWGEEVVLGTGEAEIPQIVSKLRSGGYTGTLAIEREAGNQRIADIRTAKELIESLVG